MWGGAGDVKLSAVSVLGKLSRCCSMQCIAAGQQYSVEILYSFYDANNSF